MRIIQQYIAWTCRPDTCLNHVVMIVVKERPGQRELCCVVCMIGVWHVTVKHGMDVGLTLACDVSHK